MYDVGISLQLDSNVIRYIPVFRTKMKLYKVFSDIKEPCHPIHSPLEKPLSAVLSMALFRPLPVHSLLLAALFSPPAEGVRDDVEGPPLGEEVPPGEPFHEVRLTLVLLGARGLARPTLACEGHVPALVLGVLQRRVVVLQHDLCEDTISAMAFFLCGDRARKRKRQGRRGGGEG